MFADIRGFTPLSEKMAPNELRWLLNKFYAAASEIIIKNDGLVDKFIGDAVMALFNAPIPQPRHREVALRTAVALHGQVNALELPFGIGIGLNSGMAWTGDVGADEVKDYTAIGDTVNVASRLAGLARPGEIMAGEFTPEGLLPPDYGFERMSLEVKGREQAIEACRIYPQSR
ncbi:MAG: adenylate/guanylate cyclase domain-containing protein [Chloroflexi bacterium]|nr:adenylate/guanylate cyclase domain-containing protein [Chloroflexota bacterium]